MRTFNKVASTINRDNLKLVPNENQPLTPEEELKNAQDKKSQIATLDALAKFLPADGRDEERKLRPKLLTAGNSFRTSRYELGKILHEYRELYRKTKKRKGMPTRFDQVLDAIGCERSSAYRYIAGYKQAEGVSADVRELAIQRGIDIAETKHLKLVNQIKIAMKKGEYSAADVLTKASAEVIRLSKVCAPTITKEPGPIPVQASRKSIDFAARKQELIAEYRKRYATAEEADKVMDTIIVAALEAQLAKLPTKKEVA